MPPAYCPRTVRIVVEVLASTDSVCLTCSARGIRDTYRCLFQNSDCLKLIGTPRTQAAYSSTLAALPKDRQRQWYAWVKGVMVRTCQLLPRSISPSTLP